MNTRNKKIPTKLMYIGGVGFVFEVNKSLNHNLISPNILAFFDGVPESEKVTKNCAFPSAIPDTDIQSSLFQHLGYEWVICSDGVFRRCHRVNCYLEYDGFCQSVVFHLDSSIVDRNIAGIICHRIQHKVVFS